MKRCSIAIASGKGGTGKTTVAVHLAELLAEQGHRVQYLDCDVEEPNGHLFLKPKIGLSKEAGILVPVVDKNKCSSCGRCADLCEYNAIAMLKKALVFPELCHGCGGCRMVCPAGAIREESRPIGVVETGQAGNLGFVHGRLNVGEPMSPPLIRAVKQLCTHEGIALLDAPPGTSCPVVATVCDADYVILVTEPTPFGLNDLRLAMELMRALHRRFGVVVNRAGSGPDEVRTYCRAQGISILAEIPDDRKVAETYSRGEMSLSANPTFRAAISDLAVRILGDIPKQVEA